MDEKEALRIRKALLMSVLQDGKCKSIDDAIKLAERAYNWIVKGPQS